MKGKGKNNYNDTYTRREPRGPPTYCPPGQEHPKAVLFMGLPGSGKTTVKQQRFEIGFTANSRYPYDRPKMADERSYVDVAPDNIKKGTRRNFVFS